MGGGGSGGNWEESGHAEGSKEVAVDGEGGGKGDLGRRGGVTRQLQKSRDYWRRNVNGRQGKRGRNK